MSEALVPDVCEIRRSAGVEGVGKGRVGVRVGVRVGFRVRMRERGRRDEGLHGYFM
jgi:hypothetical protein